MKNRMLKESIVILSFLLCLSAHYQSAAQNVVKLGDPEWVNSEDHYERFTSRNTSTTDTTKNDKEVEIFVLVDRMPSFQGCGSLESEVQRTTCTYNKIQEYLAKTVRNPKNSYTAGTVYVSFVIGKEGEIKDAKILRGLGAEYDEEALRVVRAMPTWTPGSQRGKHVNVQYNLPVRFKER